MRKITMFGLSLVGLFDAAYLTWVYTSASRPMVCLGTGCDVVRASSYANLAGIPLPAFGAAMYAALAILIFAQPLLSARLETLDRYAVAVIAGAGFLFSLYLTDIEAFVLHAWCAWCVVSALAVTLISVLALLELVRPTRYADRGVAIRAAAQLLVVFVAAVVLGAPAFLFLKHTGALPPPQAVSAEILSERLVRLDSHIAGDPKSAVTIVEFGDFQCPACGAAEPAAREIRKKFGDQIRFIFRHFPLERVHPFAEKAAEGSECAAEQGKFWEAAERFYAGQSDLSKAALMRYAQSLGLDEGRFRQCLLSGAMTARVHRDAEDARALGVRVTPTFFVGRQRIEGPIDVAWFSALVDQELANHGVAMGEPRNLTANPVPGGSPGSHASSGTRPPAAKPQSSATGLMAGSPGRFFSQFQSSEMACSEDEAAKRQPQLITTSEARRYFESGAKALFVDVRPAKDFASGRIPGAINVPVDEFERRWNRLPKGQRIVLYEGGRAAGDVCASSRAAGRVLLANGFDRGRVKVYQDGLAGWEKAGLAVEH